MSTMLPPQKKHSIDDDYETQKLNVRAPEVCVDYLSYRFDEMDLAASWRVVTKRKKDILNGIRLENASWRTWAKQKNNLKTISPETLNWLKDSDVTWLYGPLHTVIKNMEEEDRFAKPKISTTEDMLGLMTPQPRANQRHTNTANQPLKSALKKVTASELLRRSAIPKVTNVHESLSIRDANKRFKAFSPAVIATHRQHKLRFNQSVEQCIALPTGGSQYSTDHSYAQDSDSDYEDAAVRERATLWRSIQKISPARLKSSSHSEQETDDISSLSSSASSTHSGHHLPWLVNREALEERPPPSSSSSSSSEDEESDITIREAPEMTIQAGISSLQSPPTDIPSAGKHARSHVKRQKGVEWAGESDAYEAHSSSDEENAYGFDHEELEEWASQPKTLPPSSSSTTSSSATLSLPSSRPFCGKHILGKSVAVSEPTTVDATDPSLNYSKTITIQHTAAHLQRSANLGSFNTSSSSRNNDGSASCDQSVLSHLAQWASSYFRPKSS